MEKLKTKYLGIDLKNPIIVAASPLTSTLDNLKKCEDNNCAAVVLPSIFEEDIDYLVKKDIDASSDYMSHSDSYDYLSESSRMHYMDNYFSLIEKAKRSIKIPIIASINCKGIGSWVDYVKSISRLKVDAIEINHFVLPSDSRKSSDFYFQNYINVIEEVRKNTNLPLTLKLGAYFTDVAHVLKSFSKNDIQGLVLFNRFFRTDINTKNLKLINGSMISSSDEYYLSLLWSALTSGEIEADICGNTGIHSAETIAKFILSGSKAVELCSVFIKNGIEYANTLVNDLEKYVNEHDTTIKKMTGLLAQESIKNPEVWERSQYIKSVHKS